uniref:Uncharacterized protein n=2 Tax=Oryza TaxID=4527 RepID=A0A0E0PYD1_ORYRU
RRQNRNPHTTPTPHSARALRAHLTHSKKLSPFSLVASPCSPASAFAAAHGRSGRRGDRPRAAANPGGRPRRGCLGRAAAGRAARRHRRRLAGEGVVATTGAGAGGEEPGVQAARGGHLRAQGSWGR